MDAIEACDVLGRCEVFGRWVITNDRYHSALRDVVRKVMAVAGARLSDAVIRRVADVGEDFALGDETRHYGDWWGAVPGMVYHLPDLTAPLSRVVWPGRGSRSFMEESLVSRYRQVIIDVPSLERTCLALRVLHRDLRVLVGLRGEEKLRLVCGDHRCRRQLTFVAGRITVMACSCEKLSVSRLPEYVQDWFLETAG